MSRPSSASSRPWSVCPERRTSDAGVAAAGAGGTRGAVGGGGVAAAGGAGAAAIRTTSSSSRGVRGSAALRPQ